MLEISHLIYSIKSVKMRHQDSCQQGENWLENIADNNLMCKIFFGGEKPLRYVYCETEGRPDSL